MDEAIDEVLEKPPDEAASFELSVGDVMSDEYVAVERGTTVADALDQFRSHSPDDADESTIYYVYVTDESGRVESVVSVRELLASTPETIVDDLGSDEVVTFDIDADAEQAAQDMADIHFVAVPVVEEGRLVGVVRSDRLIDVVREESSDDILRQAGLDLPEMTKTDFTDIETERSTLMLDASLRQILRIRVPWLIVALAGGFLAGGVIGVYEEQLAQVVILAFFIPVVMDMGGNVGTQSSTIFIRGVVLGHIDRSNVVRRIVKETIAGALIGILVGLVAAAVAYLWLSLLRGDAAAIELAIVVFGAMVGTSTVAAMVGFVIPWVMYVAGFDPAAASNPVVTTIKDVSGLLIYFGLALFLVAELGAV